jgi:hypothetical protein
LLAIREAQSDTTPTHLDHMPNLGVVSNQSRQEEDCDDDEDDQIKRRETALPDP